MKRTAQSLLEDVCYVAKSLQEHPELWDKDALVEATELVDSLFSLAEVVEGGAS